MSGQKKIESIVTKTLISGGLFVPVLVLMCAGCEPISPEDAAFFKEQNRLRGEKIQTMRAAGVGVSMEDVISRVKQYPAHEGEGAMEDWIAGEIERIGGQLLFPRWNASRRGSNIQAVTYEFILMDDDGRMTRYACTWNVDVLDMTVTNPDLVELEGVDSPDEMLENQHIRRVQQHESHLK